MNNYFLSRKKEDTVALPVGISFLEADAGKASACHLGLPTQTTAPFASWRKFSPPIKYSNSIWKFSLYRDFNVPTTICSNGNLRPQVRKGQDSVFQTGSTNVKFADLYVTLGTRSGSRRHVAVCSNSEDPINQALQVASKEQLAGRKLKKNRRFHWTSSFASFETHAANLDLISPSRKNSCYTP